MNQFRAKSLLTTKWLVLLLGTGLLVACGGGGGGSSDYGTGGGNTGDGYNDPPTGGDDVEPTLASIQEKVFTPICTACHIGAAAPEGLRLEAGMSYGMLVNVDSNEVPTLKRVAPGDPDNSYIIHKLEGTNAVGERMPLGGPYLSPATIAAIRQWITDGALETSSAPQGEFAKLTAAWPVADSTLREPPTAITLIADRELDASLIHAGSVQLLQLDRIDPVSNSPQAVSDLDIRITSYSPTVLRLSVPADRWLPGIYEVRVKGNGMAPLADRSGRLIDGDGDGMQGGDFVMRFVVGSAQ